MIANFTDAKVHYCPKTRYTNKSSILIDLPCLPFVLCCKLYTRVTCKYVYAFN